MGRALTLTGERPSVDQPFEIPEDINALDTEQFSHLLTSLNDDQFSQFLATVGDDQLIELQDKAVAAFDAKYTATSITPSDLAAARKLKAGVEKFRAERTRRRTEAEAAAAELDALAAEVHGDQAAQAEDGEGEDEPGEVEAAAVEPEPVKPDPEPTLQASSVIPPRRPALDLSSVRRRQPRVLPESKPSIEITASVDVPGLVPGQAMDLSDVPKAIISRANALKTAGGGTGLVISYRHPTPKALTVTDSSSAPEGTTVVMAAADQRRLPQGDIVASGGWCAPSETLYDIVDISCPEMLWDAPEIELSRGGIRYFLTPPLDVAQLTWIHTEADDISGAEKPCYVIPCPEPVEVRCDAVGVCLQAGILTQRHFPELVNWYLRNTMVALEIRIRQALLQQLLASPMTTQVTIAPSFGALSAVYAAVALQAADMIERYSLCERISLEVVFPWWARNLFLTDLARQNGVNVCDLDPNCIQDLFRTLGVRVQFARGIGPAVPDEIGGEDPATQWPAEIQFVIYPAGSVQIGRGESVDLGVVHDSARFRTNDYTALFAETCVALIQRMEARAVTVPVCPDGATGAQLEMVCAAGESPGALS